MNSSEKVASKPLSRMEGLAHALRAFIGTAQPSTTSPPLASLEDKRNLTDDYLEYLWAVAACALVTLFAIAVRDVLDPANLILLYLIAVVLVSVRFGRNAAILASFLSVLMFDFFLVPPYHSFSVADTQYLLTFSIMLAVALLISHLTSNLHERARIAHYRERRTAALFDLSKELSAALTNEQIIEIAAFHLKIMFHAQVRIFLPDQDGRFFLTDANSCSSTSRITLEIVQVVHDQPLNGPNVESLRYHDHVLYVPLRAPMCIRGVLALSAESPPYCMLPEKQRLVQTCAAQIALAVERVHYVEVAHDAQLATESERLRNSLLSALSHDVRTPLTAIIGLSSALSGGESLSPQIRQKLAITLQDEAARMNNLVMNLLDMARLDSGPIQLNCQWQYVEEVIGSSLSLLSRTLDGRPVEVIMPPTIPPLYFDAVMMERVFCNLLENAAKYSPPGSPLCIGAERRDDQVQIWVDDQGPGVPAGMEEAIFTKFTRGVYESASSGVGLGLSICSTIVTAHGGRIWVEDAPDGGARFLLNLPVRLPPRDDAIGALSETFSRIPSRE